jgi:hypothetical protein
VTAAADLLIGVLVLGLVIYRQLIPRRVKSNTRIVLILAVIGLIQTAQYLHGRHIDATLIAEILGSLVLAGLFGLARASTVRVYFRDGQWWSRGSWITAILWIVSVAAHLGFDYLVGGHGSGSTSSGSTSFGNATLLLYLAVTFAVQRGVVIMRSQRMSIPGQNEATA